MDINRRDVDPVGHGWRFSVSFDLVPAHRRISVPEYHVEHRRQCTSR